MTAKSDRMATQKPKRSNFPFHFAEGMREIAERRVHELSKPGEPMSMTGYLNKLIREDGRKHAPKKSKQ